MARCPRLLSQTVLSLMCRDWLVLCEIRGKCNLWIPFGSLKPTERLAEVLLAMYGGQHERSHFGLISSHYSGGL